MQAFFIACVIAVAVATPTDPGHPKPKGRVEEEFIQLNVRKDDGNGKVQQVELRVHVIEGIVHINNHRVYHELITAVHLHADLTCHGRTRKAMVQVRVMVEERQAANGMKELVVQEEIVEVDAKKVTQINVKEVVLHMKDGKTEFSRTVSVMTLEKSKIHHIKRDADKHVTFKNEGVLPDVPYKATKKDMDMFHKIPHADVKPPRLPDSPLRGEPKDGEEDDDDDEHEGKKHHKHHGHKHGHHHHGKHHHHHHHHNQFKKWKRGFCHWFHRLPLAARIAIFISVVLVGISIIGCCVKCLCCSKHANAEGQKVEGTEEEKKESVEDFDVVGPLPHKKPIDEIKLIV